MADLAGKVALVTGSSSGIGAGVARRLAAEGMRVVVNSVRSVEEGESLAAELEGAAYLQADVADQAQAVDLVQRTVDRMGGLDVLVNNAGTTVRIPHADLEAASPDVWRRIFDVNVIGTWQLTVAAMPHLKASGDGSVINVTSLAGVRPTGSSIPYAASKAALNHLTRLLAAVVGPEVRVNAVAPGLISTPWTADWDDTHAAVQAMAPLRRSGEPDDMAEVVLALLRSRYTTGEVWISDGGMHLR